MTVGRIFLRLAELIVTVLGAVTIVFFASRVIPTDPAVALAGPQAEQQTIDAVRERYGLDRPLVHQYLDYLTNLAQGDFGVSSQSGTSVGEELLTRVPATLELVAGALLLSLIVAGLLGIPAAARPGGIADRVSNGAALVGTALPTFLLAIGLLYLFYTVLEVAPSPTGRLGSGGAPESITGFLVLDALLRGDAPLAARALSHLALPAVSLAFALVPQLVRVIRATVRRALASEAVKAARIAGVRGPAYWMRYVLSLAVVPVITLIASSFGYLIGGTVIVEVIFGWNGLGTYTVNAVAASDYNVVQGVVVVAAAAYALAYLVADIISWVVDPRILEGTHG